MDRRKFIYIEGNIGAGKTKVLETLKEKYPASIHVEFEPIEIWQNYRDRFNLLSLMYANPKEYAFKFQIVAQTTQIQRETRVLNQKKRKKFNFFERSIRTQKLFVDSLYSNGITFLDWCILSDLYKVTAEQIKNYRIIYLRTEPTVCLERINQRARPGESDITLKYLQLLHRQHEKTFKEDECIIIDGNLPIEKIIDVIVKTLNIK